MKKILKSLFGFVILLVFLTVINLDVVQAATPSDGTYTFISAVSNADGTVTTADGFFLLSGSNGNAATCKMSADKFGAFISDGTTNVSEYESYIEVRVASTGSFYLTNANIGEYQIDATNHPNPSFKNVYVAAYANGVKLAQTTGYDSINNFEAEFSINYSPITNILMDSFRVYYTVMPGTVQSEFNLVNFDLSGCSTAPAVPTQITSFDSITAVSAGYAGSATYANASAVISALPTTVTANSNAVSVPASTWVDTDNYNPNVAGSYTFTATLGTIPTGYANDGGYTATVEVVVTAPTQITSFDPITAVSAGYAGSATYANASAVISSLPTTVKANSNTVTVPASTWVDTDSYNPNVAGSYTFTATLGTIPTGYANAGGYTATVEVVVTAPTQITSFDPITVVSAGYAGSATYANASAVISALPTTVKANSNTVTVPASTWVDTDSYNPNAAGSYTFTATLGTIPTGYANAGGHTATVEVVVTAPTQITSFDSIAAVDAGYAGSATYANASAVISALPGTVKANSNTVTVPASTWVDTDSYNPNAAGSYTFTATLGTIPTGYANAGGYTATVEVVVTAPTQITSFDSIAAVDAGYAGSATYANASAVISALPATVKANSNTVTVPASTWVDTDSYNPNAAGSYTFTATLGTIPTGYANAGGYTATVEVVVTAPTQITSFDSIAAVDAGYAGSAAYANAADIISVLPATVNANSNTVSVPASTWVDTDSYNPNVAGSYTFTATLGTIPTGYANAGGYTATVEVVVTAPTQITSFDSITAVDAGYAGSATYTNATAVVASLPTTVTANGNTVTVPASTWVDTDSYNPNVAGNYTFTATLGTIPTGYANAGGYTATVEVVVTAKIQITSFDPMRALNAGYAGSAAYANASTVIATLPTTVTANGNTVTVPASTWVDTDSYNPNVAGSYTFTATLGTIPTGYANAGGHTATVEVVVTAKIQITSFDSITAVNAGYAGSAAYADAAAVIAALPTSVKANSNAVTVPVNTWVNTDSYNPNVAGSYTFTATLGTIPVGYANDGGYTATVEVVVMQPKYTVTYNLNGGSGTAPIDTKQYLEGDSVLLAGGDTIIKSNYSFSGWALTTNGSVITTSSYTITNSNVTFYAVWIRNPERVIIPDNKENSGKDVEEVRQVDVNGINNNSTNTVSTVDITRKTTEDKKIDSVVLNQNKADEIIQKVIEKQQKIVQVVVDEIPGDKADEVTVTLEKDSVKKMSESNLAFEVKTNDVSIQIPMESLQGISENNEDLYFRVVPIENEEKQSETIQNAITAGIIQNATGSNEVVALGTPMTIETNYQNFKTKIVFSLKDITIPTDPSMRETFLNSLGVYINHSDGDQEFNRGTIKYDNDGIPTGIEIEITKFSTFTIVSVKNTAPVASDPILLGKAVFGNQLSITYNYSDADSDEQGDSLITWYRADDQNGRNKKVISEGTSLTYLITKEDQGKYIIAEITPIAKTGETTGIAVSTSIRISNNVAPKAVSMKLKGKTVVGNILTVSYTYTDTDQDMEGKTIIRWYRSDDLNGSNKELIKGADKLTYKLTRQEINKYIIVEIIPVAKTGVKTGSSVIKVSGMSVTEPKVEYHSHVLLGLIRDQRYAEKVAILFETNYTDVKTEVRKEGSYYRISLDFVNKASALAACEDMKKKEFIVNYYFTKR